MHHSVNLKARLRRHARNSLYQRTTILSIVRKFKVLAAVVVLVLPIYPSFGQMGYTPSSVGEYDASSILVSYAGEASDSSDNSVFATDTGYLKPASLLATARDVSGMNSLIEYTVESGDSIAMIADKFRVSNDSILWANNFAKNKVIHPGDVIKIPPVSGVVYTVESMDTVDAIAKKFQVDAGSIQNQNSIAANSELQIGQKLVIPNAKPQEVLLAVAAAKTAATKAANAKAAAKKTTTGRTTSATAVSKGAEYAGKQYAIAYTGKSRGFVWGNCTYFVAMNKTVTWRGNAKEWLRNAAKQGVPTGSTPATGSIVVFNGYGYNPYYGHVGIVLEVNDDHIIVKDMNYRALNEITIRKVDKSDGAIKGYIYVN